MATIAALEKVGMRGCKPVLVIRIRSDLVFLPYLDQEFENGSRRVPTLNIKTHNRKKYIFNTTFLGPFKKKVFNIALCSFYLVIIRGWIELRIRPKNGLDKKTLAPTVLLAT
jgi:hypothetical protein